YGYRALAFSTSLGATWNLVSLLVVFRRRYGRLIGPEMGFALLQMVAASAVLGLILSVLSPLCLGQAATAEGLAQGSGQTLRAVVGLGLLGGAGGVGGLGRRQHAAALRGRPCGSRESRSRTRCSRPW
ncbi:MAG TPA: hypothetical protein PKZ28_09205, partial [Piscinibacter sp.]|nr:hypothetical protein [Piscinibacter sp.]